MPKKQKPKKEPLCLLLERAMQDAAQAVPEALTCSESAYIDALLEALDLMQTGASMRREELDDEELDEQLED